MLKRAERLTRRRDFAAVYGRDDRENQEKTQRADGKSVRPLSARKPTRSWANDLLVLYVRRHAPSGAKETGETELVNLGQVETRRFGFSVSKKVGKAHDRNRVKRRLREVCRKHGNIWRTGFDAVFIARSASGAAAFDALEEAVLQLARRAGITL